jgi:hypothetical protein
LGNGNKATAGTPAADYPSDVVGLGMIDLLRDRQHLPVN